MPTSGHQTHTTRQYFARSAPTVRRARQELFELRATSLASWVSPGCSIAASTCPSAGGSVRLMGANGRPNPDLTLQGKTNIETSEARMQSLVSKL